MKSIHWIAVAIFATSHTYAIETMDEIVVQSTRIPTSLDLSTSSVEVITEADIFEGNKELVHPFYQADTGIKDGGHERGEQTPPCTSTVLYTNTGAVLFLTRGSFRPPKPTRGRWYQRDFDSIIMKGTL